MRWTFVALLVLHYFLNVAWQKLGNAFFFYKVTRQNIVDFLRDSVFNDVTIMLALYDNILNKLPIFSRIGYQDGSC